MSYPSNRNPRDREHTYFEDEDRERGVEGRGRSYLNERGQDFQHRRPGEREPREGERFGERRYLDPYSGRTLGTEDDHRRREYAPRQQGYAPYPYGEEPPFRHLEDWQRPWQIGEESTYGAQQRSYGSRSYGSRSHESQTEQGRMQGRS